MTKLFFSYSHKDEVLRDELQTHLAALMRNGTITTWHDRRIEAGKELAGEIDRNLEAADIILLLFSPDFLASDYCFDIEAKRALERHHEGTASVIPVILRPCSWLETDFKKLMAAPTDGKPVVKWADRDEAFVDVTEKIAAAARSLAGTPGLPAGAPQPPSSRSTPTPPVTSSRAGPRSSNLGITKTFNDRDKATFLREAVEYVTRFFENSLTELEDRNPDLKTAFEQIDARSFEATVFQDGKQRSRCGIWLETGRYFSGGGIYYSSAGVTPGTSNEQLIVEADENSLHLKALLDMSGHHDKKLTFEGGAERLWAMFIHPLQQRW